MNAMKLVIVSFILSTVVGCAKEQPVAARPEEPLAEDKATEERKASHDGNARTNKAEAGSPMAEKKDKPKDKAPIVEDKPKDKPKSDKKKANVEWVKPGEFKIGQVGTIVPNPQFLERSSQGYPLGRADYWFAVQSVLSDNEVVIREVFSRRNNPGRSMQFIVEMPTKNLADDAIINLEGVMEVVGRKKIGTRTLFVIRSVPD